MANFVTDRTQADVDRLAYLRAKGWKNLSSSEQYEWHNAAAKGAYNHTDLNRVEQGVADLAKDRNLNLSTKTDWTYLDVPTRSQMERYLSNIIAIQQAYPSATRYPVLPDSLDNLTFMVANNIERTLEIAFGELMIV